jgi:hypothetical protein
MRFNTQQGSEILVEKNFHRQKTLPPFTPSEQQQGYPELQKRALPTPRVAIYYRLTVVDA